MERRILGIENEYGVTCTFRGQRRLSPDEVARYLFRKVVSWGRSSNVFLRHPVVEVLAGSLLRSRRAEAVGRRRSLARLPATVQRHGLGVVVAQRVRGLDEMVGFEVAVGNAGGLSHTCTVIRRPGVQTPADAQRCAPLGVRCLAWTAGSSGWRTSTA